MHLSDNLFVRINLLQMESKSATLHSRNTGPNTNICQKQLHLLFCRGTNHLGTVIPEEIV